MLKEYSRYQAANLRRIQLALGISRDLVYGFANRGLRSFIRLDYYRRQYSIGIIPFAYLGS